MPYPVSSANWWQFFLSSSGLLECKLAFWSKLYKWMLHFQSSGRFLSLFHLKFESKAFVFLLLSLHLASCGSQEAEYSCSALKRSHVGPCQPCISSSFFLCVLLKDNWNGFWKGVVILCSFLSSRYSISCKCLSLQIFCLLHICLKNSHASGLTYCELQQLGSYWPIQTLLGDGFAASTSKQTAQGYFGVILQETVHHQCIFSLIVVFSKCRSLCECTILSVK